MTLRPKAVVQMVRVHSDSGCGWILGDEDPLHILQITISFDDIHVDSELMSILERFMSSIIGSEAYVIGRQLSNKAMHT